MRSVTTPVNLNVKSTSWWSLGLEDDIICASYIGGTENLCVKMFKVGEPLHGGNPTLSAIDVGFQWYGKASQLENILGCKTNHVLQQDQHKPTCTILFLSVCVCSLAHPRKLKLNTEAEQNSYTQYKVRENS